MHPVCFHLGGLTVHWYGVFMALAFLTGLGNWVWLGRRDGRSPTFCSDLLFWVMVSGILGARVAYVVADLDYFLREPLRIIRVDEGGLIYYGGFVGAGAALAVFARRRGVALVPLIDFVITSVPLAHAVGRIGCFMNGCCFGGPHAGFPAVTFPRESLPWHAQVAQGLVSRFSARTVPVHPVQLYEAVWNLVVYAALVAVYVRKPKAGLVTAFYLLLYPVGRFALEFFRGTERLQWRGLSSAQWISLLLLALGLGLILRVLRRRRRGKGLAL
jgi:phosphatidylglycerol:prolipoprotein diacylglycerol transferase